MIKHIWIGHASTGYQLGQFKKNWNPMAGFSRQDPLRLKLCTSGTLQILTTKLEWGKVRKLYLSFDKNTLQYTKLIKVILNYTDKEKELIATIRRMRGIIEQQTGSTSTIASCVGRYLAEAGADYLQSGVMDAIDRGLFNSKIVPIKPKKVK